MQSIAHLCSSVLIRGSIPLLVVAAFLLTACEPADPPQTTNQSQSTQPRSAWHTQGETSVVGIDDPIIERELQAASERARATAPEARQRWLNEPQHNEPLRGEWFVKWAAPTAEQSVEHVWVQPINWSPFRIEGILVSAPVHQLMSPKSQGDLVSFPIEELSDWIYFPATTGIATASTRLNSSPAPPSHNPHRVFDPNLPHDGGFTIKVLEKRFGKPNRHF